MIPARKTFGVLAASHPGLMTMPTGGDRKNLASGKFTQFSAAAIAKIDYNCSYYDRSSFSEKPAAAIITLTHNSQTLAFLQADWPTGIGQLINQMYCAAMSGRHVSLRDFMNAWDAPSSDTADPVRPAPGGRGILSM